MEMHPITIDHGLLLGRDDDDHTQYWLAGAASGRTDDFTTAGTVTAGIVIVDAMTINAGTITNPGGTVLENTFSNDLTLRNTTRDADITLSVNQAGTPRTMKFVGSTYEWLPSTGAFRVAGNIIPGGTFDLGGTGADRWDNIFGSIGNFDTSLSVSTLSLAGGSITDSTGQISFGNEKLVFGNVNSTLTGTTDLRFVVDGDTTPIAIAGGVQMGYDLSNTYNGTWITGAVAKGFKISNNQTATFTGSDLTSGGTFVNRCVELINTWSGNIIRDRNAAVIIEHLGIELENSVTGTLDNDRGVGSAFTFNSTGGRFTSDFKGTLDESQGNLIVNIIGGVFRARSSSAPTLINTPEINYIGGDSMAEVPSAFSSLATAIGHRFAASGGDTNIGLQVLTITNANLLNIGLDIADITGATTPFAIRTGLGTVSFGDDVKLTDTKFLIFPKASGNGIKVDTTTPTFGFADLLGEVFARNTGANKPTRATWKGGTRGFQFGVNDEEEFEFHIPHDYVKGTDIFLHLHWGHNVTTVTGGTVTFDYDATYAKGHNQGVFGANAVGTVVSGTVTSSQYSHDLSEGQFSISGASGTQIDTDDLEPDGVIKITIGVSANNITVSGGGVPDPFIHYVDIHYQTTSIIGTKSKIPDFYV